MFIYSVANTEVPASPAARRRPWHAVEVVAGAGACKAVSGVAGCRVLSCDAPRLPLAACDVARCTCTYRHFGDRRRADRRGHLPSPLQQLREPIDRRAHRGRRATD